MPILSASDLETTHLEKRSGFLEIALRKNREALPYIDQARALRASAQVYSDPKSLVSEPDFRFALSEAAGISKKASAFLNEDDVNSIIHEFVKVVLEPAGSDFVDELVYRFLLAKGDALGGRMRNIVGGMAAEKLTRYIIASVTNSGRDCHVYLNKSKFEWIESCYLNQDDYKNVKLMKWKNSAGVDRQLMYNVNVPTVKKNIDIIILRKILPNDFNSNLIKNLTKDEDAYIALGELKGGIDPAGADEHWKTANTALSRIRSSFQEKNLNISTFFVGAAIEKSMSEEIFQQLKSKNLTYAANLTNEMQIAELCAWINSL
jgi:hypothetical protein